MDRTVRTVLGIITARGGSKGVPRKNIRPLDGKPLLQYTAEAALGSLRLSRVILTTDDEEIAEVGRNCGLEVPFLRPKQLAADDTPTLPVLQHAVRWFEERGARFDAVCLLQPTNPFRRSGDIDGCIETLQNTDADAVVTIVRVPDEYNPHWVYFTDAAGYLRLSTGQATPIPRRQALPPAFCREGSVYVTRRDVLMGSDSLYGRKLIGYLMKTATWLNIDRPEDFERAAAMMAKSKL